MVVFSLIGLQVYLYGAPDHPIVTTGQVYRVGAAWGAVRFATARQRSEVDLLNRQMEWIFIPLLVAVGLWRWYIPSPNIKSEM